MKPLIIGLPFDNGIRSMLKLGRGIIGASNAPKVVFNKLNTLNVEKIMLPLQEFNLDENTLQNDATLVAHNLITKEISKFSKENFIIAVGGDHSLTYPIFKGIKNNLNKDLSLLYLDAHFDMRSIEEEGIISSGNSFYRIIEEKLTTKIAVLGINNSNSNSFKTQFNYAQKNDVDITFIDKTSENTLKQKLDFLSKPIYISIDIDVVNENFAPGVSARNKRGLTEEQILKFIKIIMDYDIAAIDIMETSSRQGDEISLDKTSFLVARIIELIVENYK